MTEPVDTTATTPAEQDASSESRSLEDLLSGVDDHAREVILGEVKKARGESARYRSQLRDVQPKLTEYEKWQESQKSETEKLQSQVTAAQEAQKAANRRALLAEVKSLAADSFADPADAAAFLNVDQYIGESGDFDSDRIGTDLKALLEKKPHLGKPADHRGPKPDPALHSSQDQSTSNDPAATLQSFFARQLQR